MNISQGTILFNLIAFLAWFCLRQYFVYRLLLVFSKERFRRGISVTVFVLISLVLLAAELLNLNYLQLQTYAVVELLMLLSAFLLFRSDIVKRFQIIVLTFECLKLIDFFFQAMLSTLLLGSSADFFSVSIERGAMLLSYALILFFVHRKLLGFVKKQLADSWILQLPGLFLTILLALIGDLFSKLYLDLITESFFRLWFFVMLTAALFVILSVVTAEIQKRKTAEKFRESRYEALAESYRKLNRDYQERRQLLHDTKNHYLLLQKYAENGETEKIQSMIQEILPDSSAQGLRTFSAHEVLDMIISVKTAEAEKAGIRCSVFSDDLSEVRLADDEICVLFGNLFDNAIEALQDSGMEDRWIDLSMKRQGALLFIQMRNPCREEPRMKNGRPVSPKGGDLHGLGIPMIDRIAAAHDGDAAFSFADGVFTASLYLNAQDQPLHEK